MTATECVTSEYVILVDEQDNQIGLAEKLEAHQKNLLHRAFSVFIFRRHPKVETLQQRALQIPLSGLWTTLAALIPAQGKPSSWRVKGVYSRSWDSRLTLRI